MFFLLGIVRGELQIAVVFVEPAAEHQKIVLLEMLGVIGFEDGLVDFVLRFDVERLRRIKNDSIAQLYRFFFERIGL